MAFASTIHWEVQDGGDDSNNGGGFNPANPNMVTDWVVTNANTSSPIISSASYTLIARDANHWWFAQAGSGLIPGWYKIASVSGGSGTLSAGIGTSPLYNGASAINTVAGVSASSSLSSITGTIDYSQGLPITINDMVAPTSTTFTSAGTPIGKNFIGNIFRMSNVIGWSNISWECVSVTGTTGTAGNFQGSNTGIASPGSTGGLGNCGGPLISAGRAMAYFVSQNKLFIKRGAAAYAISTSSTNTAGGCVLVQTGNAGAVTAVNIIRGYTTVRWDESTKPILKLNSGVSSATVINLSGGSASTEVSNLEIDCNSQTTSSGMAAFPSDYGNRFVDCTVKNSTSRAFYVGSTGFGMQIRRCIADTFSGNNGFSVTNSGTTVSQCEARNGSVIAFLIGYGSFAIDCIVDTSTSTGFYANSDGVVFMNCVAYACLRAIDQNGGAGYTAINCVAVNCSGYGFNATSSSDGTRLVNCAGYNNTSGNINPNITTSKCTNFKALTGSPFTNAASGDFSLNNTSGAGAVLRGSGYPTTFPRGLTASYRDIGASQHTDPAVSILVHSGMTGGMRG